MSPAARCLDAPPASLRVERPPVEPIAYSPEEVGALMGLHVETIRRAIRAGDLRCVRLKRAIRVSRAELARWWRDRGGGDVFDGEAPPPPAARPALLARTADGGALELPDMLEELRELARTVELAALAEAEGTPGGLMACRAVLADAAARVVHRARLAGLVEQGGAR